MSNPASNITTVGELMTGDLVTVRSVDPVSRAHQILVASGLHALPVMHNDAAVGIVTLADCVEHLLDEELSRVANIPPVTISVDGTISEAATLMREEVIHHLLVTESGSDEVVGILSSLDLVKILV